jgi:flagellar biosynthetic protein FliP
LRVRVWLLCIAMLLVFIKPMPVMAQAQFTLPAPRLSVGVEQAQGADDVALTLQIIILLTILALAPSILVLLTSFTRTIVVLSFVRTAMGVNQMPPNQVLIGLALFLTFFTMAPTWQAINTNALQPYLAGELDFRAAGEQAETPLREFMFKFTRQKDLALFASMSGNPPPADIKDVPTYVLVPAFVISELKSAFQMGFVLYIPFLVIDMIVASVLMSLGMMMLPPVMISLPFKLLLFVLVDGWHIVIRSLLLGYA